MGAAVLLSDDMFDVERVFLFVLLSQPAVFTAIS